MSLGQPEAFGELYAKHFAAVYRYVAGRLGPDAADDLAAETFKGTDGDEYLTELDEATWRKLRVGCRCRLKTGALGDEVKQVTAL
jgi:hypothetical protein